MGALTQEAFARAAAALGVPLEREVLQRFARYRELTAAANARFNLTSSVALADIERVHFLDALSLAPLLPRGTTSLVDVGSGGGFPGLVLAAALPELRVTLVEASRKRAAFLRETAAALGVAARVEEGRAETLARAPELREASDAATARALGALPVVLELTLPFLRAGGVLL
ncbi:MAG: 16S rRNA (guanine(527)-N(7))-methyltransferase RsmG, partial [Chloroflexota bacterium]|nr:16S rRNA (guanine(527)-N(7))-methyltransferase RsmG [Chloroflexota bacterium]